MFFLFCQNLDTIYLLFLEVATTKIAKDPILPTKGASRASASPSTLFSPFCSDLGLLPLYRKRFFLLVVSVKRLYIS